MNSNLFNVRIVIHSILLAITSAAFIWTLSRDYLLVTRFSLGVLWIFQIVLLIIYVNKTNRDLLLFLRSFEFQDDTLTFNKNKKLPFKPLYSEFNRIIENFRKVKLEKEMEQQYFQYSIKHVDTGLISIDEQGKVELFNEAAKRLLHLEYVQNIHGFNRIKEGLADQFRNLTPGKQDMVKLVREHEILSLSIRAAEFKLQEKHIKLISLQNIKNELDEQELDSWQKLIRVLTHEIINSVSPITLLSSTLVKMFEEDGKPKKLTDLEEGQIENALKGLQAISKRSKGLSRFVDSYKSLSKIPEPVIGSVSVNELFEHILTLMKKDIESHDIQINSTVRPNDLEINADEKLIEQVLINLLKNAIEAGKDENDFKIELSGYEERGNVKIEVSDNGPGISSEVIDNIFVPFFTTKKDGSGIGLSLSKQILRKHGGNLEAVSKEGAGATFTVTL
ncbi:MAG: GHKL domain-containing protein [Cyclobacteriaceae bacterium]|nr:GHKL domain-containing protein [Cyclobacteriaceae bacterium]